MPPGHPLLELKSPIDAQWFLDSRLLLREPGSGSRLALEQHCLQHRLRLNIEQELGSTEVIKHAVMAGAGVAVVPSQAVIAELLLGRLMSPTIKGFPFAAPGVWSIQWLKTCHRWRVILSVLFNPIWRAFISIFMLRRMHFDGCPLIAY